MQDRPHVGFHWFDPFGSTSFTDICNVPPVDGTANLRLIMWDQEPLYSERIDNFLEQFLPIYQGPVRMVVSELGESVKWINDTYGIECDYYFFHAWAALDWYRGYDRTFLAKPYRSRSISKTFLCPNNIVGGKRIHRLALLNELVDRELIDNNFISFPAVCPYEHKTVAELCQEHDIHLGAVNLPLVIDAGQDFRTHSSKIDLWDQAEQSLLQVVTETVYQGARSHLTEKTFKPIVMEQPFVLVGCQGSLDYLRSYGFQTFNTVWDESYDLADDNSRIIKVAKLLSDINSMSQHERNQIQKHIAPIVEYNKQWFYSKEFETMLWQELQGVLSKW